MENTALSLGSLFDGSGAFPFGGILAGIEPKWSSEIEPFPVLVTHRRLPQVRHYGDVSAIHGGELEPVDIITFGSPCQNLSIAGHQAGLQGEQSSLFFEAVRIIKEMRNATEHRYPRFCVWENVPNALSCTSGKDFQQVLSSLIQIADEHADVPMPQNNRWLSAGEILGDHYSLAWRVLDASKGWGVAQRRKRIFLVLDLGGTCAGKILFESEGLSGFAPPGAKARQGDSRSPESSFTEFTTQLNLAVPYKNTTAKFLGVDMLHYSGLSCYIPSTKYPKLNAYYKQLAWNQKVKVIE